MTGSLWQQPEKEAARDHDYLVWWASARGKKLYLRLRQGLVGKTLIYEISGEIWENMKEGWFSLKELTEDVLLLFFP